MLFLLASCCVCSAAVAADYPEQAQDKLIIETVLRLEGFDLNSSEKAQAAVMRYLRHNAGSETFFELIRKFRITQASDLLLELAAERPEETEGVEAARLLLKMEQTEALQEAIARGDQRAANVVTALGQSGEKEAAQLLAPLLTDEKRPLAVRSAAARAVARQPQGEQQLLKLVTDDKLPEDLHFTVANVLHTSASEKIRRQAAEHLPLPATADAEPLPPLAELVKSRGDPARGHEVFRSKGTCIKCHQVGAEGKEVGPDLSEIGSKLTREAMYVAILDPSAGISHNYETFQAILANGTAFSGVKISETDDSVTLKSAEAIERTIPREEIDEIYKQKVSLMPADLQKTMSVEQLVDVVEYLTTLKKQGE